MPPRATRPRPRDPPCFPDRPVRRSSAVSGSSVRPRRRRATCAVASPAVGKSRGWGLGPRRLAIWLRPGLWPQISTWPQRRIRAGAAAATGTSRVGEVQFPGALQPAWLSIRSAPRHDLGRRPGALRGAHDNEIRNQAADARGARPFPGPRRRRAASAGARSPPRRIARVAPGHAAAASAGAYPQTPTLDLGLEHAHRLVGRRRQRPAGAQAKARAMARADDLGALDCAARQLRAVVRAHVLDREELVRRCAPPRSCAVPPRSRSASRPSRERSAAASRVDPLQSAPRSHHAGLQARLFRHHGVVPRRIEHQFDVGARDGRNDLAPCRARPGPAPRPCRSRARSASS